MTRGRIFDIQRFSVHDGPGIRTTVFFKGCPLRCLWCHNPESIRGEPELAVTEERCIHCGQCVEACPSGRLAARGRMDGSGAVDELPECTLCGTCAAVCPTGARRIVGRELGVGELLGEILRDRLFYDDSGGGATFSGGEPLAQPDFLAAALDACRGVGIRTAVDTSGFCRREDLLRIAPLADLVLFDLKQMDDREHRRLTGVSNARILENLRALARVHDRIWIRVPVIPGLNDDPAHLEAAARFAASLPGVRRVHLLPYHRHGVHKRARFDGPAAPTPAPSPTRTLPEIPGEVSPERLERLAGIVRDQGLEAHIGG